MLSEARAPSAVMRAPATTPASRKVACLQIQTDNDHAGDDE
jgi:hypothetical protein